MFLDKSITHLKNSKNLLAFSGGVDSTALFFILLDNGVAFDIAIVDYGVREQSKDEVAYAKELAYKYNLTCHLYKSEKIIKNFEAKAREIRYDFFHRLIKEYSYENLLTAHHLGDRFEWMLMQFCKGAGCAELGSMRIAEQRDSYRVLRPLLEVDKSELLEYLHKNNIKYFEDESNFDESYKRNYFRKHHTEPLIKKYLGGIKKSFSYIDRDIDEIIEDVEISSVNQFAYFRSTNQRSDIFHIDKYLKANGYVMTSPQRSELQSRSTAIIGRKFVVNFFKDYVFIAPYVKVSKMDKAFKEKMRMLKIDPKLRGYLYLDGDAVELLFSLCL